jgi:hypothetical protein
MKHSLDLTKNICLCTLISIILIILFMLTPLSGFFKTSLFMKIAALILLGYTIYLSLHQSNLLRMMDRINDNPQLDSQVNINIICSYIFTLFLILLFFFIIRNLLSF